MNPYDINLDACRGRQRRLLEVMHQRKLDLAIVTQIEHIQWLAGPRFAWTFQPAACLSAEGQLILVAPNQPPDVAAADEVFTYPAQLHATLRNDQRQASSSVLESVLRGFTGKVRIGIEYSGFSRHFHPTYTVDYSDIESDLYRLRRRKDPDELARIKKAIAATGRMYKLAREIIEPGISELEVFNRLQAAAVEEFGEPLTGTGNDYQCASPGGPPRNRQAQAGELYILDLGPAFRGYFADNCRTIAVDHQPSDAQQRAWEQIVQVFPLVERMVKPGAKCLELFRQAETLLAEAPVGKFNHHLGHGIGLFLHEAPHLNPSWDDTFEEGEVFTCEPGLYAPELRAGIRLENNYLVTSPGVELLSDFPLEL